MDTVSILIPAYNAEKFLHRCIDSILGQTYKKLEIVIVNDGSLDNTLSVCFEYAKKDCRVKVIDQENMGVAAARNVALENACGEWILFVDADDWIEQDMVELMLKALAYTERTDMVFCCHDSAEIPGQMQRKNDTHIIEIWEQERQQFEFMKHKKMTGMLWNKLIRRRLFENVRFDPSVGYGEDAQVLWKLLKKSRNMAVIGETLYHHIMEKHSISHQSYSSKKFSSIKMWQEIEEDIYTNFPQWKYLVKERQLANATYLLYEMKHSAIKNKEEKKAMRKVVRENLSAIFHKGGVSLKMKIYALVVAMGF